AVFGTEPDRSSFAGVAEGFLMSTTRRALLRAQNALAVALVLAVALIAFSPAPHAEAAPRPSGDRLVKIAASERGTPYRAGGSGPGGFDCSGLTQWSYAQAGVALPRTSQAQRHAGRQIPLSEARPGDLVLYRSDASHVGMYMGNGQVVHAPYPGAPVRYDPVGMMPVSSVTRV
ncbi:C40 family peptidase, partial [Streptomyces sp. G35A]